MSGPSFRGRRSAAAFALALGALTPIAFAQPTEGAGPNVGPARPAGAPSGTPPLRPAPSAQPAGPTGAPSATAGPTQAPPSATGGNAARSAELRAKGNRAWDEGRYADALVDYEEAVRVFPEPKAVYNLAAAYQKVGRNAEALTWFLRFKATASRDELDQTPNLDKRIAALRNQVALLKVSVNVVGARVLVRDTVVGTKPADGPLEVAVNAGRAVIEIDADGYKPYREELDLQRGGPTVINVQLSQRSDPKPTERVIIVRDRPVDAKPFWSQWWFWAGAGALAAGGAVTVYALSTEKSPGEGTIGRVPGPLGAKPSSFGLQF
jgi:transcriptional activator/PEGA domain-containing protein